MPGKSVSCPTCLHAWPAPSIRFYLKRASMATLPTRSARLDSRSRIGQRRDDSGATIRSSLRNQGAVIRFLDERTLLNRQLVSRTVVQAKRVFCKSILIRPRDAVDRDSLPARAAQKNRDVTGPSRDRPLHVRYIVVAGVGLAARRGICAMRRVDEDPREDSDRHRLMDPLRRDGNVSSGSATQSSWDDRTTVSRGILSKEPYRRRFIRHPPSRKERLAQREYRLRQWAASPDGKASPYASVPIFKWAGRPSQGHTSSLQCPSDVRDTLRARAISNMSKIMAAVGVPKDAADNLKDQETVERPRTTDSGVWCEGTGGNERRGKFVRQRINDHNRSFSTTDPTNTVSTADSTARPLSDSRQSLHASVPESHSLFSMDTVYSEMATQLRRTEASEGKNRSDGWRNGTSPARVRLSHRDEERRLNNGDHDVLARRSRNPEHIQRSDRDGESPNVCTVVNWNNGVRKISDQHRNYSDRDSNFSDRQSDTRSFVSDSTQDDTRHAARSENLNRKLPCSILKSSSKYQSDLATRGTQSDRFLSHSMSDPTSLSYTVASTGSVPLMVLHYQPHTSSGSVVDRQVAPPDIPACPVVYECVCRKCKKHNKKSPARYYVLGPELQGSKPIFVTGALLPETPSKTSTKASIKSRLRSNRTETTSIASDFSSRTMMEMFTGCFRCFGDDDSDSSDSGGSDSCNDDDEDYGDPSDAYEEHGDDVSVDEDSDGGDSGSDSCGEVSLDSAELFDDHTNMFDMKNALADGEASDGGPNSDGSDSDSLTELRSRSKKGSGDEEEEGSRELDDDDDDFDDSLDSVVIYDRE